jgi:Sulfotransferase family
MIRSVICHYHIFKNAGTSFDHILTHSFGDRHLSFDGPFPFFTIDQEQLDRIIARRPDALALSSHQIRLPAPVSQAYRILAVVFLRDPFLRIQSIWRFKRASADGTSTSAAAARLCFADWLRHSLDHPDEIAQVSNGQTRALAARHRSRPDLRRFPDRIEYDMDVARTNLSSVPLIGRTETFADDVGRFQGQLADAGLTLCIPQDIHLNATDATTCDPRDRVRWLLDSLPDDLCDRLIAANRQDVSLCDMADAMIGQNRSAA